METCKVGECFYKHLVNKDQLSKATFHDDLNKLLESIIKDRVELTGRGKKHPTETILFIIMQNLFKHDREIYDDFLPGLMEYSSSVVDSSREMFVRSGENEAIMPEKVFKFVKSNLELRDHYKESMKDFFNDVYHYIMESMTKEIYHTDHKIRYDEVEDRSVVHLPDPRSECFEEFFLKIFELIINQMFFDGTMNEFTRSLNKLISYIQTMNFGVITGITEHLTYYGKVDVESLRGEDGFILLDREDPVLFEMANMIKFDQKHIELLARYKRDANTMIREWTMLEPEEMKKRDIVKLIVDTFPFAASVDEFKAYTEKFKDERFTSESDIFMEIARLIDFYISTKLTIYLYGKMRDDMIRTREIRQDLNIMNICINEVFLVPFKEFILNKKQNKLLEIDNK